MTGLKPFYKTALIEATAPMSGGILYFLGSYFIRLIRMIMLIGIWRSIFSFNGELVTEQATAVLQYTLLASAFSQQIDVETTASTTFWEGTVSSRYLRPISVFGQFIAETIGGWLPGLVFFTVPVLLLSPVLGINMMPTSISVVLGFTISLLIGITTGFALDFIFTGFMVILGNKHYFAYEVRTAVTAFLSGAVIPLYMMPGKLENFLELLPFASMASAPLQIFTGTGDKIKLVVLQIVWCIVLWILAVFIWKKIKQRLVIFGG